MIIVIIIGSVNHPNLSWSYGEIIKAISLSRIIVIMVTLGFFLLNVLKVKNEFSYYVGMGVIMRTIEQHVLLVVKKSG